MIGIAEKIIQPDEATVQALASVISNFPTKYVDQTDEKWEKLKADLAPYNAVIATDTRVACCYLEDGSLGIAPAILGHPKHSVASLIRHELIHRGQFGRIRSSGRMPVYREKRRNDIKRIAPENRKVAYHSDPHELMGYARMMVDEVVHAKLNIFDFLRRMSLRDVFGEVFEPTPSPTAKIYHDVIRYVDPRAWKRFLRYAYEYATQLPENRSHRIVNFLLED